MKKELEEEMQQIAPARSGLVDNPE